MVDLEFEETSYKDDPHKGYFSGIDARARINTIER
jgi:hypothetical protein